MGQAEIAGVPEKLLCLWSKRTAQIKEESGPKIAEYEKLLGRTLTSAERVSVVKTAVLKTRPGKEHPELSALHEHWTAEARQAGFSSEQVLSTVRDVAGPAHVRPARQRGIGIDRTLAGPAETLAETRAGTLAGTLAGPAGTLAEILAGPAGGDRDAPLGTDSADPGDRLGVVPESAAGDVVWSFAAVRAAGQRRAVFSRADVAGQVAALMPASGLGAGQVLAEVERITTLALGLTETVPVGDQPRGVTPPASDARFATQQVLEAEARVLSLAERGRRGGYGRLPLPELMPHARALGLDGGQYKAVLELAGAGDFLSVLTAPPAPARPAPSGLRRRRGKTPGIGSSVSPRPPGPPRNSPTRPAGTRTRSRSGSTPVTGSATSHPAPPNGPGRPWMTGPS